MHQGEGVVVLRIGNPRFNPASLWLMPGDSRSATALSSQLDDCVGIQLAVLRPPAAGSEGWGLEAAGIGLEVCSREAATLSSLPSHPLSAPLPSQTPLSHSKPLEDFPTASVGSGLPEVAGQETAAGVATVPLLVQASKDAAVVQVAGAMMSAL